MDNLLPNTKLTRVASATAAGQTEIDGTALDMEGFASVAFIASLPSVANTGVVRLTVQGRNTSSEGWTDLVSVTHTSTGAETNRLLAVECPAPMKKSVRCALFRTVANSAIDCIVALQGRATYLPVTQPAGVDTSTALPT